MVDGRDFPSLGINLASREDVGGDGDGVEWVIVVSDDGNRAQKRCAGFMMLGPGLLRIAS